MDHIAHYVQCLGSSASAPPARQCQPAYISLSPNQWTHTSSLSLRNAAESPMLQVPWPDWSILMCSSMGSCPSIRGSSQPDACLSLSLLTPRRQYGPSANSYPCSDSERSTREMQASFLLPFREQCAAANGVARSPLRPQNLRDRALA